MFKLLAIAALAVVVFGATDLQPLLDADIETWNKRDDTREVFAYFRAQLTPWARIISASIGFTGELSRCTREIANNPNNQLEVNRSIRRVGNVTRDRNTRRMSFDMEMTPNFYALATARVNSSDVRLIIEGVYHVIGDFIVIIFEPRALPFVKRQSTPYLGNQKQLLSVTSCDTRNCRQQNRCHCAH